MSCQFCIGATGDVKAMIKAMISPVVHRNCEHCGYPAGLGPFVHVRWADTPMITEAELETAEPGLYVIQGDAPNVPRTMTADRIYDVTTDEWIEGPHVMTLMARVREDDGRPLPKNTLGAWKRADGRSGAWTRDDGRQVITQFKLPEAK